MVEIGYVKSVSGKYANVAFKRKSGCGDNCANCGGSCSVPNSIVKVENILNASVGDQVQINLETKSFLKMTFWAYGFPLIMTILGVLIGNTYFPKLGLKNYEMFSAALGVILLSISFMLLSVIDKKVSSKSEYDLKMIKVMK